MKQKKKKQKKTKKKKKKKKKKKTALVQPNRNCYRPISSLAPTSCSERLTPSRVSRLNHVIMNNQQAWPGETGRCSEVNDAQPQFGTGNYVGTHTPPAPHLPQRKICFVPINVP